MVLVTGSTGMVGTYLLYALSKRGKKIRALYRNDAKKEKTALFFKHRNAETLWQKISWVKGDILDISALAKAFEGVETVYHAAGLISFDPKDEAALRRVNIEGTANIVNFALDFRVKSLCYVSSIAALGDVIKTDEVITENTDWNPEKPHSDYAISKYGGEMEVWRGQEEGLKIVIVNPGVIFGKDFYTEGSGSIFRKLSQGMRYYTVGSTGFVTVEDVTDAMIALVENKIFGEKFILVGDHLSFKTIADTVADTFGVIKPTKKANLFILSCAWRMDWIRSFVFSKKRKLPKNTAISLHSVSVYDNSKLKKVISFEYGDVLDYIRTMAIDYKNSKQKL
jgi:dihydroflavonol-4-reductase